MMWPDNNQNLGRTVPINHPVEVKPDELIRHADIFIQGHIERITIRRSARISDANMAAALRMIADQYATKHDAVS